MSLKREPINVTIDETVKNDASGSGIIEALNRAIQTVKVRTGTPEFGTPVAMAMVVFGTEGEETIVAASPSLAAHVAQGVHIFSHEIIPTLTGKSIEEFFGLTGEAEEVEAKGTGEVAPARIPDPVTLGPHVLDYYGNKIPTKH